MKRLAILFTFLVIYCAPLAVAQAQEIVYEEVNDFGVEEINARKTYPELAEELKQIFIEIDKALAKIKSEDISLELQDLNTEEFNNLSLSEQLKIFKQNYSALTDFTSSSMEIISHNAKEFANFCNLQSKLFVKFNELLEEGSRIQKSQDEDLALALAEIKKAQETASSMKTQLETCIMLARIQAEELEKAKKKITYGAISGGLIGLGAGIMITTLIVSAANNDTLNNIQYKAPLFIGAASCVLGAGGLVFTFRF